MTAANESPGVAGVVRGPSGEDVPTTGNSGEVGKQVSRVAARRADGGGYQATEWPREEGGAGNWGWTTPSTIYLHDHMKV